MDERPADARLGRRLGPREQALVTSALPMVERLVGRVRRRFPEIESAELRSVGYEAAAEAAMTFDPNHGSDFAAYALKRILGALVRVGPSESFGALHIHLRRAFLAAPPDPPSELSLDEVLLDTPEAARERALVWIRRQAAGMLVAALYDASERVVGGEAELVELEARRRADEALTRALGALTDDERYFVERHYRDGATFDVIATELAVVARTIGRLHDRVKEKLAKSLRGEGIEAAPPVGEE